MVQGDYIEVLMIRAIVREPIYKESIIIQDSQRFGSVLGGAISTFCSVCSQFRYFEDSLLLIYKFLDVVLVPIHVCQNWM